MTKRVFFSFHYEDVKTFRANVVRNHGLTKETGLAGFFDASIWEDAKLHGDASVKRLITTNLTNTSVTCVLIGSNTWSRRWVRYEILKSFEKGNLLLGVHINGITDKNGQKFLQGKNPFNHLGFYIDQYGTLTYFDRNEGDWQVYNDIAPQKTTFERKYWGKGYTLSDWVPCYDWVNHNGFNNFSTWVNNAK